MGAGWVRMELIGKVVLPENPMGAGRVEVEVLYKVVLPVNQASLLPLHLSTCPASAWDIAFSKFHWSACCILPCQLQAAYAQEGMLGGMQLL